MAQPNANGPPNVAGQPAPLFLLPPEQHHDWRLRTDLRPVIDPIPLPQLKDNAPPNTRLITTPSVNNNLLTPATLAHYIPNITIGQVHQSIIQVLPNHNHRIAGNRRLSQSVAAVIAVKEYLSIAEVSISPNIIDDTRFCSGKGSAIPDAHCQNFKNFAVAKVIVDAWFSHTRVRNSRCINQLNHYQVHANFFRPLAERFVLNVNPCGELNLDAILGTNPAESNNTYRRKTRNFGVWDNHISAKSAEDQRLRQKRAEIQQALSTQTIVMQRLKKIKKLLVTSSA
jgi:hypothetical protein